MAEGDFRHSCKGDHWHLPARGLCAAMLEFLDAIAQSGVDIVCLSIRLLVLVTLSGLGACSATTRVEAPSGVLEARRYFLIGADVHQTYQIDVLPVLSPVNPPSPGRRLPVLFVLDGNLLFPGVVSMASMLSLSEMPSVLVVGIGYQLDPSLAPGPFLLQYQARRNHDYTPTLDHAFLSQMEATYARYGASYPAQGTPGGAAAFLAFIDSELKPFIRAHYPEADPDDATIMGDSLGGLFAMHVLQTSPRSFKRYIASSPSLWWDDRLLMRSSFDLADTRPRLFVSMGSLEPPAEMAAPVAEMDARLKALPPEALDYRFQLFEGETHSSAVFSGFSRGLREVFR